MHHWSSAQSYYCQAWGNFEHNTNSEHNQIQSVIGRNQSLASILPEKICPTWMRRWPYESTICMSSGLNLDSTQAFSIYTFLKVECHAGGSSGRFRIWKRVMQELESVGHTPPEKLIKVRRVEIASFLECICQFHRGVFATWVSSLWHSSARKSAAMPLGWKDSVYNSNVQQHWCSTSRA